MGLGNKLRSCQGVWCLHVTNNTACAACGGSATCGANSSTACAVLRSCSCTQLTSHMTGHQEFKAMNSQAEAFQEAAGRCCLAHLGDQRCTQSDLAYRLGCGIAACLSGADSWFCGRFRGVLPSGARLSMRLIKERSPLSILWAARYASFGWRGRLGAHAFLCCTVRALRCHTELDLPCTGQLEA